MLSQRQQSLHGLPASLPVSKRKDKLYNDFLELLKEENMLFPPVEVDSVGKNLVKMMVECLWYLDGHYEKLKSNLLNSRLLRKIHWLQSSSTIQAQEEAKH